MSPLEHLIRAEIEGAGPMRLDRYIELALGHPEHGYYMARQAIGAGGDFTTAPEISQMFGEIVGAWLAHLWTMMGAPSPVALVELGPGRGTLMADIWRTFALVPALREVAEIHLVETSPRLRDEQHRRLSRLPVSWHDRLEEVPDMPMLLVANEFFDALPIRQLVRRGEEWRERRVGLSPDGELCFVDGEAVDAQLGAAFAGAPEGSFAEIGEAAAKVAEVIGRRLATRPGAGLVIDYGYARAAPGDTLQALRGKRFSDPLRAPGEADLTAHVDFGALMAAASSAGAASFGPISQASFLTSLGIGMRAERLRRAGADPADLSTAVERLTGIGAMGDLFRVLALATPGLPTPPPFDS